METDNWSQIINTYLQNISPPGFDYRLQYNYIYNGLVDKSKQLGFNEIQMRVILNYASNLTQDPVIWLVIMNEIAKQLKYANTTW